MSFTFQRQEFSFLRKILSSTIVVAFALSLIMPPTTVLAQGVSNLPTPGTFVSMSSAYNPAIVEGITIYPDNPLQFDFIIDVGDDDLKGDALRKETQKLISYFMATLTVPEDEMWVNLSPYEKNVLLLMV